MVLVHTTFLVEIYMVNNSSYQFGKHSVIVVIFSFTYSLFVEYGKTICNKMKGNRVLQYSRQQNTNIDK